MIKFYCKPFLKVKFGDIRTLFLKDSQNKFYIIGNVFRQMLELMMIEIYNFLFNWRR